MLFNMATFEFEQFVINDKYLNTQSHFQLEKTYSEVTEAGGELNRGRALLRVQYQTWSIQCMSLTHIKPDNRVVLGPKGPP